MGPTEIDAAPTRVLVLTASTADAAVVGRLLGDEGLEPRDCAGIGALVDELRRGGAGAVVLAEETLEEANLELLAEVLADQPEWSDLPLVLLTASGRDPTRTVDRFWQIAESRVTVLERPVRSQTLLAATRAALRARHHQLRIRDELERRNAFLATLAHELRNPLAPLRTGVEVLRRAEDPETLSGGLDVLERQTDRLSRLIDDLLDVNRITHGRLELKKELVELGEIFRGALEAATPLAEEAGHRLEVSRPEEPLHLQADPLRLEQILINLLSNAVKYTPEGGRIQLVAERLGGGDVGRVRISVRDDGIGIEPEAIDRLFDLFEQVERTPGGNDGLGIGLALAKSLTEMHGGSLEATSEGPGRGATFSVLLPTVEPAEEDGEPSRDPEPRPESTRRWRVLVVDDNRDGAELLARLVELLGHEAHLSFDGRDAVEKVARLRPHLVLLDIGLPEISGFQVARQIRALEGGREIVLAAVSGWNQESDRRQAFESGLDLHLTKPLQPERLRALLADLPSFADRDTGRHRASLRASPGAGPSPEVRSSGEGTEGSATREPRRLVHDLRGSLHGMGLTLRLIRHRARNTGDSRLEELVLRADRSAEKMKDAVEKLSAASRGEAED